jgi:IS1 family transposase/transposase-like protein
MAMHVCPKCQSDRLVNNGSATGKPKKQWKQGGYQFTRTTPRGKPLKMKINAVLLYLSGISMHRIAFLLRVSAQSVLNWIRALAKEHEKKPEPTGKTILVALDEMWHYLKKKRCKLWIWKALDQETGQLLDWECGRRDKATLKKMVARLAKWDVKLYCTDKWATDASVIPQDTLVQSQATTHTIERNHCRQRHWFGRFKRKSIIISKSKEMVELTMNLSHYQSLDPKMDRGKRQKRLEAGGDALPPDHQAAIFLLKPGKRALSLEPRDHLFYRSATVVLRLPDPLRNLCPDSTLPELLTECFCIVAFIRRDDLEAFAGAATFPSADLDGIKQRHHLGTLIPVGRRRAIRQWHPVPLREAVDEDPFAFPPVGDALAATLPRGKKRHQRRHTPNESSLVLRQSPECGPASRPGCHPPASAATSDASRSSTPMATRVEHHTSDSQ